MAAAKNEKRSLLWAALVAGTQQNLSNLFLPFDIYDSNPPPVGARWKWREKGFRCFFFNRPLSKLEFDPRWGEKKRKDQTRFVLFPLPQFNDDQQPNISLNIMKTHCLISPIQLNFHTILYFLLFNFYLIQLRILWKVALFKDFSDFDLSEKNKFSKEDKMLWHLDDCFIY